MLLSVILPLFYLVLQCCASLVAIDYGAEFSKSSLMKPGLPLDVLLTRDSKRKLQSVVGWKGTERLFGSEAYSIAARYPRDSFQSLKFLLGVPYTNEKAYNQSLISLAKTIPSSRETFAVERSDGSVWDVEELVAMQFAYIKELADSLGNEAIRDAVVTVPAYFSQSQRQAVLDSLEVGGLRPLALINDGTAVAVNYAMTRSFAVPETHIIYDAGASSIRATVVTFYSKAAPSTSTTSSKSITSKEKEVTHIEIKGIGYDLVAGGIELDRRLRDILQNEFEKKIGKPMSSDRAAAKLAREAGRVKAILSLNAESSVNVESLFEDIDFRAKVSRETFENACSDLKPRYTQPIIDALEGAGLSLDNISSVILTGGASRTPMIQASVVQFVGEDKIAKNVNADEAAVLGAAFYGASLSPMFRTKEIKIQDIVPYSVQISYPAGSRTINTLLFPQGSKAGLKKTVSMKRKEEDFTVRFSYKEPHVPLNMPTEFLDITIEGVAGAAKNLTESGAKEATAKLTVQYSDSGITSVRDAVLLGEGYEQTIAGALKGFFGGTKTPEEEQEADKETPSDSDAAQQVLEKAPTNDVKEETKKEYTLTHSPTPLSIMPLSHAEKSESRKRLVSIAAIEQAKRRREEARNQLESYLYRLRDLLDSDSGSAFMEYSTEEERVTIAALLRETMTWMNQEAEDAETFALREKKEALEHIEKPIHDRHKEAQDRPQALSDLQRALTAGRIFLISAEYNRTEEDPDTPPKYTEKELEDVKTLLENTESWLQEGLTKQESLTKSQDPAIKSREMTSRGMVLQDTVLRLQRRKAPKKPRPSSSRTESSSPPTASSSATISYESAEPTGDQDSESIPPHRDEL